MSKERKITKKEPSAARLIESLRDTGYSFETAIADLVDNSIAARASHIEIQALINNDGHQIVYIADNGHGMDEDTLEDAMTYGSNERGEKRSLGKFGLGMKTASTSQARCFTVVTKNETGVSSATWDIDHVIEENEWELIWDHEEQDSLEDIINQLPNNTLNLVPVAINPEKEKPEDIRYRCPHSEFGEKGDKNLDQVLEHISRTYGTPKGSGTIVLWEKIDRVIKKYADPKGDFAKDAWKNKIDSLREHLAMVFERYLSDEYKQRPTIKISLNDEDLIPWDPFCKKHKHTTVISRQKFEVKDIQGNWIGDIKATAYSVPHTSQFEDNDARKAAKMDEANKWQGIYVYREDRMLVAHEWFKLRARESHMNCLRIELDFDYRLDDDLQLDFKKTRVIFQPEIRKTLRDKWLVTVAREAQRRYRERNKTKAGEKAKKEAHKESDNVIDGLKVDGIEVTAPEGTPDGKQIVDIRNPEGNHKVTITVSSTEGGSTRVKPVDTLFGDMIYEPALINGKKGVNLNVSHEFYRRVYEPNQHLRSVTMGLDGLFWGLSIAELKAIPASDTARWFEQLRWELTRIMDEYAKELPEPEENSD